ncbi:DUF2512 family protein [Salibacterium halotolerans]|uniref:4 TMS phage holin, superfamily IV n=1 Tax=Salibacterium halotolerans TaxID=1884432 RepID=A0A1I5Y7M4_9BACI|nr:DUF2512 family protein [Salibacterium halotolerans]SFQ40231.1 Protein of unknown function [Salibacterium halotolerans]
MKHTKALLIKGITTLIVLFLILGIMYGVSFLPVLLLTIIVGAVSYPGDIFILPKIQNVPAVLADFVLAFILLWGAGAVLSGVDVPAAGAAIAAAVLAFCEYYFHMYLATHVLPSNNNLMMDTQ